MKALILAAGFGSRLAPITDNNPKSMVPVNGKPILEKQIENLLVNNINDITIITGYKAEVIENMVSEKYPFIKLINSVDYATTNNMYSAYLAKDLFINEPFYMMNADVFFDSSVIAELSKDKYKSAIVVDEGTYNEESMKVIYNGEKITAISKQIPIEEALGCSIDVYKFSKEDGKKFFNKCSEYIDDKKELKLWSEVALNDILNKSHFESCPLVGRWFEIDNHDDLAKASDLFKNDEKTYVK